MDEFDETAKKLVEEWYEKEVVINLLEQSDLESLRLRIAAALRAQEEKFGCPRCQWNERDAPPHEGEE